MIIQQKLLKIKYMASNVNVAYAWSSNDLMAFWLQSSSQNIHRKKM